MEINSDIINNIARALNPLSDIFIRYLLGSERNKDLLLDFVIFPELSNFHTCFSITEKDNPEYILTEHLQIHFIEMRKLNNLNEKDLKDKLLAWCYFLQNEGNLKEDKMPVLIKDDDTFKKAHEEYERFTADKSLMYAMEAHEKWLKDYNSRMGDAWDDGVEEGKRQTAKKLKQQGIAPKTISDATGLTPEEIKKL